jgi:hypothetical protein
MTKIFDRCGTGSVGFLDLHGVSFSDLEQVLPLSKVATKTQAFRGLEALTHRSIRLPDFPAISEALRYSLRDW